MSLSSRFDARLGAGLGALALCGLALAAALGAPAPWWAGLAAALPCLLLALRPPSPRAGREADDDGDRARRAGDAGAPARREMDREMHRIAEALSRAAAGDLEGRIVPLPRDPQAREMARNLNHALDIADAFVREVGGTLTAVSRKQHHRRLLPHGFHGDFARVARQVDAATQEMGVKVARFAELTVQFEARLVAVSEAVTDSAEALEVTARGVSDTVARARSGAGSIDGAAVAALGNVESVATSAQEMDGAMAAVSGRAADSLGMAERAVEETKAAAAAVESLSGAATRIDEVMQMIKGVSDYTKLLAVNASVEAARAGHAGKGFAVVAAEVQSLATQSADATREAAEQIKAVQGGVQSAVAAMTSVSATIDALAQTAKATTSAVDGQREEIRGVAANMDQAACSSGEVAAHVRDVSGAIEATERAAGDVLDAAHKLNEQAADLRMELETYLAAAKAA